MTYSRRSCPAIKKRGDRDSILSLYVRVFNASSGLVAFLGFSCGVFVNGFSSHPNTRKAKPGNLIAAG